MRKVVKIVDKENSGFDAVYWSTQTSEQRIDALSHLRAQYSTKDGIRQRLQRVCRVIDRQ